MDTKRFNSTMVAGSSGVDTIGHRRERQLTRSEAGEGVHIHLEHIVRTDNAKGTPFEDHQSSLDV